MGIHYSVEADPDTTAKAMLRERPISLKHSKAIARAIKGKTIPDAEAYLEAVIAKERSVPFKQHNTGVGHRSDIDGWDAGRYPQKASQAFLDLLTNVRNNAREQGFDPDEMVIDHVAPHKVGERVGRKPRAFGRASPWNTTLCDVELIVEAPEDAAADADADDEDETATEVSDEEEAEETEVAEGDEKTAETDDAAAAVDSGPQELEAISGISETKADALREAGYETVTDVRAASEGELTDVHGIGNALAARIKADVGGLTIEEPDEGDDVDGSDEGDAGDESDEAADLDESDEDDAAGESANEEDGEPTDQSADETEEDN